MAKEGMPERKLNRGDLKEGKDSKAKLAMRVESLLNRSMRDMCLRVARPFEYDDLVNILMSDDEIAAVGLLRGVIHVETSRLNVALAPQVTVALPKCEDNLFPIHSAPSRFLRCHDPFAMEIRETAALIYDIAKQWCDAWNSFEHVNKRATEWGCYKTYIPWIIPLLDGVDNQESKAVIEAHEPECTIPFTLEQRKYMMQGHTLLTRLHLMAPPMVSLYGDECHVTCTYSVRGGDMPNRPSPFDA